MGCECLKIFWNPVVPYHSYCSTWLLGTFNKTEKQEVEEGVIDCCSMPNEQIGNVSSISQRTCCIQMSALFYQS
jgi:hypothetical protein